MKWPFLHTVGLAVLIATSHAGTAQQPGGPPREAVSACQGGRADAACSVETPRGTIEGTCRSIRGALACVPAQPPGGGPGGGGSASGGPGGGSRPGGGPGGGGGVSRNGYDPGPPYAEAKVLANSLADTGQVTCFNDTRVTDCPAEGEAFFGQDAHYRSRPFSFRDNGDGTVSDLHTGLLWQKAHNAERLTYYRASSACAGLGLGRRDDWRLPTIKELFSIADFRGSQGRRFFIDSDTFDIEVPGEEILEGDRFAATHRVEMMGQTWSSTIYTGKHWDREGVEAAFFFNYFDGHIKQAPTRGNTMFHRCVAGVPWGDNSFADNRDGTVTDAATGLMWQQADDGKTSDWKGALSYCEGLTLAGHDDWRLPNVKELQNIVDYGRSDPALDTGYMTQTDPDAWFWSSTTHGDNIRMASYVCFGKCISVDGVDVHGAGAQRADPKTGEPTDYTSLGGQQDQVRIYNYARCAREAG